MGAGQSGQWGVWQAQEDIICDNNQGSLLNIWQILLRTDIRVESVMSLECEYYEVFVMWKLEEYSLSSYTVTTHTTAVDRSSNPFLIESSDCLT